jgi:hypothetical protein
MKEKTKKRRTKGTDGAKIRAIHQFRPRSSLFVRKNFSKGSMYRNQSKYDKPSSSPKRKVDCIEFQNQFGLMPCRK